MLLLTTELILLVLIFLQTSVGFILLFDYKQKLQNFNSTSLNDTNYSYDNLDYSYEVLNKQIKYVTFLTISFTCFLLFLILSFILPKYDYIPGTLYSMFFVIFIAYIQVSNNVS
ncbi:unnamed protein product, partial [marine sediment metagenome]